MICFPNAKINIGLYIIEKRQDSFHNLETIFYPIPLCDVLEIGSAENFQFSMSGVAIKEENICVKTYRLLKQDFKLSPIKIHLHKNIPIGAGLGGGSADAVFMIKLLNIQFDLNLSKKQMTFYADKLGSDCAFFIENIPAFATGKGELLQKIQLDLSGKFLVLVFPNIFISTKESYENIVPGMPSFSLQNAINQPIEHWEDCIFNDFEKNIFAKHPQIASIKSQLYKKGALYAAMSGSGSCVYGIFEKSVDLKNDFDGLKVFRFTL